MTDELLRVEDLTLARENRTILKDVNLTVQWGEVHALIGLNGSGKSSLAYAIMGCSGYVPDAGRIIFDGQEITDLPIDERARRRMTLAWQEPARFEGLPVFDYLALGMREPDWNRIQMALQAVALSPASYMRRPVDSTLSGGERKRIELAAVYAMHPRLAMLDEPDSGIDVLSMDDIARLVRHMANEATAVLLITHRDEMADIADRASLMCGGTIAATGAPDDVRSYFETRCRPHGHLLGPQPWQVPARDGREGQ
jgi:Fe-S cluster assembly ATP-binding protein